MNISIYATYRIIFSLFLFDAFQYIDYLAQPLICNQLDRTAEYIIKFAVTYLRKTFFSIKNYTPNARTVFPIT